FLTIGFSVSVSGVADHILGAGVCINFGIWLFSSSNLLPLFMREPFDTFVEIGSSLLILPLLLFMLYSLRNRHSFLETGIWIFAACMVIYLIFAAAESMYGTRMHDLATLLPIIGCLSFSVTQILNYYLNITASYARQEEYLSLTEKAYIDALTGLPNRKSADNVFRSLNSAVGSYCIVSMDLDNLKIINDTYGHDAGDSMLKAAADTLIESVADLGFRARMGGDEFVLVLKRVPETAVASLLEEIEEKLNGAGIVRHRIPYSISYGYAFKDEVKKGTAVDVYNLADERMYEQKTAKKRQRILEATLAQKQ
ncbi:MAG: GGDEF domain-containing protein, partial [Lachnospiraceae bacterium]|nr:GGDEF domain-containing protein [Lachnospiraceae bacterium]